MAKIEIFVLYICKTRHISQALGLTLSGEPKNKWEKRLKIVLVRVPTYFVGMSLGDFSFSSVSFSSEVRTALKAAFKRKQNQIYLIYVEHGCFN